MRELQSKLVQEALKLTPKARMYLIETLVQSLDKPDKEIDNLWIAEAEKRLKDLESGEITGIPEGKVIGK